MIDFALGQWGQLINSGGDAMIQLAGAIAVAFVAAHMIVWVNEWRHK